MRSERFKPTVNPVMGPRRSLIEEPAVEPLPNPPTPPPQPIAPAIMASASIWLDELGAQWNGGRLTGWTNRGTDGSTFDIATTENPENTYWGLRNNRPFLQLSGEGCRGLIAGPEVRVNDWEGEIWAVARYGYAEQGSIDGVAARGWFIDQHQNPLETLRHIRVGFTNRFPPSEHNPSFYINKGYGPGQGAGGSYIVAGSGDQWSMYRARYDKTANRNNIYQSTPRANGGSGANDPFPIWSKISFFGSNTNRWRGDIAELLIFDQIFDINYSQEAADIEDYLDAKWSCGQWGFDPP